MVLSEITKIFERRRTELYDLLAQRKEEIRPEVQHQIYGAMNEIDVFLRTMEYYKEKEMDREIKNAILVGPMLKEGMMSRMVNNLNKKITKMRLKKERQ